MTDEEARTAAFRRWYFTETWKADLSAALEEAFNAGWIAGQDKILND